MKQDLLQDERQRPAKKQRISERASDGHTECSICAEVKPSSSYTLNNAVSKNQCCPFAISSEDRSDPTCRQCIASHLIACIDSNGPEGLYCMHCGEIWDYKFCQYYLDNREFTRLNDVLFENFIKTHNNFVHCPSKDCDCSGIIEIDKPGYPRIECYDCKTMFCVLCQVPWHTGITCGVYRRQNGLDQEEEELIRHLQAKNTRRCPRCQLLITKDGGCDSMWCICNHTFLWSEAEPIQRRQPTRASVKKYQSPLVPAAGQYSGIPAVVCEAEAEA